MSCSSGKDTLFTEPNCPCDRYIHPPELNIPAGLDTIPRQIATFSEFRKAMLTALRSKVPLAHWRARGKDDLGIMLLEMWAYVCDVLAFYDEVIAHETYLRTARQRPSLRKLIELLGYLPRPAVAASVKLAMFAEGRKPVTLPAGAAFRSGAFNGEPPQVFETTVDTTIHPLFNSWSLASVPKPTIGNGSGSTSRLLLDPYSVNLKVDDVVLVRLLSSAKTRAGKVKSIAKIIGQDGNQYTQVDFGTSVTIPLATSPKQIRLLKPTQAASLWGIKRIKPDPYPIEAETENMKSRGIIQADMTQSETIQPQIMKLIDSDITKAGKTSTPQRTVLTLDGQYRQIKSGQYVVLQRGQEYRWFTVRNPSEHMMQTTAAGTTSVPCSGGSKVSVPTPAIKTPATQLTLDVNINDSQRRMSTLSWDNSVASEITIHYNFTDASTVTTERHTRIGPAASLALTRPIEQPEGSNSPKHFLMEDKNERGVAVKGLVNFLLKSLDLDSSTSWAPSLLMPTQVYGNVINATRGESVVGEVLGSGDASVANQSFKLKKKPLTYAAAPTTGNQSGVAGTLRVYVNGIRWKEVRSFFGIGSNEEVYIVRQNDAGESTVIFGDGTRGSRLSTGTSNVVANYRYGAGAASPPAGSITQLAKPVKGVQGVRNPVAAAGGADAESSENLRIYAPKSALILGRAVSIQDMEAVAAGVAGVRAVHAEWRWHGCKQRPVVQIWYIGQSGIEKTVSQTLRTLSDPSIPIDVKPAQGIPVTLSLDIEIDSRYVKNNVLAAVRKTLMDKKTGLLSPERIGIGQPLFRSRIFERVVSVPGAVAVQDIQWDGKSFGKFAKSPGAGKYFDLKKESLLLGKEKSDA